MKTFLFPLLAFLLLSTCQPEEQPQEQSASVINAVADSLTAELEVLCLQGHINGFGLAVVSEDRILYQAGIGYADVKTKRPYTENTVQNIASISKTVIGLALLKAQELGQLKLDDPINDYLPYEVVNPHFPEVPITIRHLTNHTSSIVDTEVYDRESYVMSSRQHESSERSISVPDHFKPADEHMPMADFLREVLHKDGEWYDAEGFLQRRPGEFFEYTNVGATLAAQVLEYATGEDFAAFSTKHVLRPLGMNASGWSLEAIDFAQHSTMYADSITDLPFYSLVTYPDGGLLTSSSDFALYLQELIRAYAGQGTLLEEDSYREYFAGQLGDHHFTERDAESKYNDEYDMGVFIGLSGQEYIGHTGGDPGVSSFMFFDKEKKIGRYLMINTDLNSQAGVDQFFGVWDKMGEFQDRL